MDSDKIEQVDFEENASNKTPDTVSFDFFKSNFHREILVNGVYGGLTPKGYLQISVFNERRPIPKQTVHRIEDNGVVGDEEKDLRLTRDSIIRSVEATLHMDIHTAEKTVKWMKKHIEKAKEIVGDPNSEKSK
jgi:hypothetical protein